MSLTLPKQYMLGKGSLCYLTIEAIYKTPAKAPEFLQSCKMELRTLSLLNFPGRNFAY